MQTTILFGELWLVDKMKERGEVDPVISWLLTKELSRPNFVNLNARRFYFALIIIGESI